MNVITLRDYAKQNNVSYEAVRKQVVRYKDELEGHLIKDGRQQLLDEEAVTFLDAKRQKNPVAIIQQDKDERIETLRQENENLLKKLNTIQEELRTTEKAFAETEKRLLIAQGEKERADKLEAQNVNLSAEREQAIQKALEAEKTAQELSDELTEAKAELERLHNRGFFKRLFNK